MHIPLELSQKKTAEFIKIYDRVFGQTISEKEAKTEVYRLLSLISLFSSAARPIASKFERTKPMVFNWPPNAT